VSQQRATAILEQAAAAQEVEAAEEVFVQSFRCTLVQQKRFRVTKLNYQYMLHPLGIMALVGAENITLIMQVNRLIS
jgi:hypothetical protein